METLLSSDPQHYAKCEVSVIGNPVHTSRHKSLGPPYLRALTMKSLEPTRTDPQGAPRDLERHTDTESAAATRSFTF